MIRRLLGLLVGKAIARLTGARYRGTIKLDLPGSKYVRLSASDRKGDEDRGFWRSLLPRVTSHGHELGPLTHNQTTGRTTWDTPGTGSVSWPRGRRR